MNLSKRALYAIAYSLLENSGKIDFFQFRKTGLKTIEEIDDFVFEITGHRMENRCKYERYSDSLKKEIKKLIDNHNI